MKPPIPIENIYYLFCYAWDQIEQGRIGSSGIEASPDLPNMLGMLLVNMFRRLATRGIERSYVAHQEQTTRISGKIVFVESIKLVINRSRARSCAVDELSEDILQNQILKATAMRLSSHPALSKDLSHGLAMIARRLANVSAIRLRAADFRRVQVYKQTSAYGLLLRVCELIFDHVLPSEDGQATSLLMLLRDEEKMAKVFEQFIKNFFRHEQSHFKVRPLQLDWAATSLDPSHRAYLPSMITDVFLTNGERSLIIDTKYYSKALQQRFSKETVRSNHLYQLFSYLSNSRTSKHRTKTMEGMLLYPTVEKAINLDFNLDEYRVRVSTINLNQPWQDIRKDLLALIQEGAIQLTPSEGTG